MNGGTFSQKHKYWVTYIVFLLVLLVHVVCDVNSGMSSTSRKHCNFVAEPMGEKPVADLAGIGDVLGGKLTDLGYDKVLFLLYFCCFNSQVCVLLPTCTDSMALPAFAAVHYCCCIPGSNHSISRAVSGPCQDR